MERGELPLLPPKPDEGKSVRPVRIRSWERKLEKVLVAMLDGASDPTPELELAIDRLGETIEWLRACRQEVEPEARESPRPRVMMRREAVLELMETHNLTASEFAKRCGLSRSIVSAWITGKCNPSPERIALMANVFDVSPGFFFSQGEFREDSGPSTASECGRSDAGSVAV